MVAIVRAGRLWSRLRLRLWLLVVAEVEVVLYLYVPNPVRISLKGRRLIWLMEIGDLLGAGEDFKLHMLPR